MRILSISPFHDSSVAVINDGELEFFCKEERITRKKRDVKPWKSVSLAKDKFGDTFDFVLISSPSNGDIGEQDYILFLQKQFSCPVINTSNQHHLAHASLAFNNSEFDEALVFVIDRNGTIYYHDGVETCREAESVFQFTHPENVKVLYKNFWMMNPLYVSNIENFRRFIEGETRGADFQCRSAFSIVKVYEAATTLIGEHPLENGKTMGLAAYGPDRVYEPMFIDQTPIDPYFTHEVGKIGIKSAPVMFSDLRPIKSFGVPEDNYIPYADKAKHVQIETQRTALNLIRRYVNKTGIKNICITGGYGLNVVANTFYKDNLPECNFYFEPLADDSGNSIGSALHHYRLETRDTKKHSLKNTFYHYYDETEVLDLDLSLDSKNVSLKDIAVLLSQGKSVAVFEGAPEAGPRALGHRSILFDPRDRNTKDKVNKIKNREWYRPFAGVIIKDYLKEYFITNFDESPHMTVNFEASQKAVEEIPGVLHVDGTSRMQTVTEGTIFELLQEFKNITNVPCLLNTSFNMAGDPLIQTKSQALDMLRQSDLDYVYFVDDNKLVFNRSI
jgi:carbamoyltransferase